MNKTRSTKAKESKSPLSSKLVFSEISVWFEPLSPFSLTQPTTRSMSSFSATALMRGNLRADLQASRGRFSDSRSEEHTSELQSLTNLVCRLLLEKKNKKQ